MNHPLLKTTAFLLALLLGPGAVLAQTDTAEARKMVQGYDLLEAGKMSQAQKFYEQILAEDPGNPLALNNLAAVMVNQKKYPAALSYLEQALPRAKGYKIRVNRVCDVQGICLAFRPLEEEYGNQELEPLIKLNMDMVKDRLKAAPQAK
jgi:tetratricopeptide (TPR) repeat protein